MKNVCIKIGGSAADAPGFYNELAASIASLQASKRYFPVIVHGGGKAIARMLDSMNKQFTFIEGMRVTDADTLRMVQMVLSGDVNKSIVNALLIRGVNAIGISGVDANLMTAEPLTVKGGDIGFVGDVKKVDLRLIDICRENALVPVVSPISRDALGNIYNVNADVAAGTLAQALKSDDFVFVSDVKGVMIQKAVRKRITVGEIEVFIAQGEITGGMIPKVHSAAEAIAHGVGNVHICGWNGADTLLNELNECSATGTVICK